MPYKAAKGVKFMERSKILSHVDHTLLAAVCTWQEITKLCDEAIKDNMASVCVPPAYVKRIHEKYAQNLNICTVIGFPLGYNTTAVKVAEAKGAIEDGAQEVDMVVNLTDVKNGDFDKVTNEIAAIKKAVGEHVLKVIIETCYLTDAEKVRACELSMKAGADFVKTSTGFSTGGATAEDIALMARTVAPRKLGVKAFLRLLT